MTNSRRTSRGPVYLMPGPGCWETLRQTMYTRNSICFW